MWLCKKTLVLAETERGAMPTFMCPIKHQIPLSSGRIRKGNGRFPEGIRKGDQGGWHGLVLCLEYFYAAISLLSSCSETSKSVEGAPGHVLDHRGLVL